MRLYIKGNFTRQIPYGYMELAGRMWFPEEKQISYSNVGNNEALQKDFTLSLMLRKGLIDEFWNKVPVDKNIAHRFYSHTDETLHLEYEDNEVSDYREKGEYLRILSTHEELLTIDKRAIYIMAIEVATALEGQISEDDKKTWLTVDEFKRKHLEILSLSFEETNKISLQEIQYIKAVDDPLWRDEENRREEYIKIHGERVYDDEDDEEEVFGF